MDRRSVLRTTAIGLPAVALAETLGPVADLIRPQIEATAYDSTVVGSIAAEAGVPTLVLHHLAPGNPAVVPDATWLRKASTGYAGTVLVGNDLLRVALGGRR